MKMFFSNYGKFHMNFKTIIITIIRHFSLFKTKRYKHRIHDMFTICSFN